MQLQLPDLLPMHQGLIFSKEAAYVQSIERLEGSTVVIGKALE